jgi:hypothetical protein
MTKQVIVTIPAGDLALRREIEQGLIVNILIEAPGGPTLPVEQAEAELLAWLLSQPDRQ